MQWAEEHWPTVTANLQNDPDSMTSTFMEILQLMYGNNEDMKLWLVATLFRNRTRSNEVTVFVVTTEEKAIVAYKAMEQTMQEKMGTGRNPIH